MKYSIGDVARVLGLTPGALHFFEREGLISPGKESNGRRYYTTADVFRLMSYKKYRAMGVPMKEITQQFSDAGDPLEAIAARLAQQREEAARRELHFRALQEDIRWFEEAIARIPTHLNRYGMGICPDVLLLHDERLKLIPATKGGQEKTRAWLEHMPTTRLSMLLSASGDHAALCYALPRERAQALGMADQPDVVHIGAQPAVHTIRKLPDDVLDTPITVFDESLEYLRQQGLAACGPAFAHMLVVDCSSGSRQCYIEVWVPVGGS